MSNLIEINIDSLVGMTHNFGGLSFGNEASMASKHIVSNPKEAALQGLSKMEKVMSLGIPQFVFPPPIRPDLEALRAQGYQGSDVDIIQMALADNPQDLLNVSSSSTMWMANAATITPSTDAKDKKLHITPANLVSNAHRAIEWTYHSTWLKELFKCVPHHIVHSPLPANYPDEGAANHTRLCYEDGSHPLHIFVYGNPEKSRKYPVRFHKESAEKIKEHHHLQEYSTWLLEQNPEGIDKGVFHNDVISVGHENVFLRHEQAFVHDITQPLKAHFSNRQYKFYDIVVRAEELTIEEAVKSYLFNSQILRKPDGNMVIIAPENCKNCTRSRAVLDRILKEENPITECQFIELNQSMKNGGGPACLRLRVPVTPMEFEHLNKRFLLTTRKLEDLKIWVKDVYPTSFSLEESLHILSLYQNDFPF